MAYPRDLVTLERACRHVLSERGVLLAGRNRRNADMLRALADVEQFEREMAACDRMLEELFTERDAARIAALADRLVQP